MSEIFGDTIENKLDRLYDYKTDIKEAINEKGVSVDDDMSTYGYAIRQISGGLPEPGQYVTGEEFNQYKETLAGVDADQTEEINKINDKLTEIELFKFPNVTIFGEPTINHGQLTDFSEDNYVLFPFLVDFHQLAFLINMVFTTGDNVDNQQNIFDSVDGLAFAVRSGRFVIAMSSDGQTWNMGEHIGNQEVRPNTTYYVNFSWNKLVYKLEVSTDNDEFITDIQVTDTRSLYAKQIIIGKGTTEGHVFGGSINLNFCKLYIMGQLVWAGMDDAGIATRLATDMSNLDAEGELKIKDIVGNNTYFYAYETKANYFNLYFFANGKQISDTNPVPEGASYTIDWVDENGTMTKNYMTGDWATVETSSGKKGVIGVNYVKNGSEITSKQFRCTLTINGKVWVRDVYSPSLVFKQNTLTMDVTFEDGTEETYTILKK